MEAYKLQIGDWFKFGNENIQVTYINCRPDFQDTPPTNEIGWDTNEDNTYINAKKAQPIPLTDEIMRANGFTPVAFGYGDYKHPLLKWYIRVGIDTDIVWSSPDNEYIHIGVQYVHDLQHALRFCGLDKLANEITV